MPLAERRSDRVSLASLKIVQVLPALEGGGVEQGTLEIARALAAAGHESIVVSRGGRMAAELAQIGTRHETWNLGRKSPRTLLEVPRFRRWLAAERPHVLHVRSRMPAWVCHLAWRGMAAPRPRFVTTVHGIYSVNRYSAVMARGERVIAVSDTAAQYIARAFPNTDPQRIVRIHRGVDQRRFRRGFAPSAGWLAQWRRAHPQLAGKRLVVLPGRLTRLKGHRDFIDAMARVRAVHADAVGLVVGAAEPRHRAYAEELRRLGAGLEFIGQRTDLREIMAISSAVASLSVRPESFGRTVLEALSLGTPVIGYDHGGVGEILAAVYPEGRVAARDPAAAGAALGRVLDDEAAARSAIRAHDFDVERMCAQTLALYGELAGGAGGTGGAGA